MPSNDNIIVISIEFSPINIRLRPAVTGLVDARLPHAVGLAEHVLRVAGYVAQIGVYGVAEVLLLMLISTVEALAALPCD